MTFNYGQRHAQELEVARDIASELGVKHHELDLSLLSQLTSNSLTDHSQTITTNEDGLPSTFVDGRNHLFLSFAAVLAKGRGIRHIVTGVCETDFSGYPDCRDVSSSHQRDIEPCDGLSIRTSHATHVARQKETWALADSLGAFDFVRNRTLTCYNGVIGDGCGECPACELRKNGLDAYIKEVQHT